MIKTTAKNNSKKCGETLSDNLAAEARELAERILDLRRAEQVAEGNLLLIGIEIGGVLDTFKHKVLHHGQFTEWVRKTCGITLRKAERCMALWRVLGEKTTLVSGLGLTNGHLVSAPETPEAVRTRVFERLEEGEVLTPREIRRMIADAKIEEEQQRLKDELRRKEIEAEAGENAKTAAAERENEGSEKTVTEPPTVDEGVNGMGSTSQDNTAGQDSAEVGAEDSPGEPAGGRPVMEAADTEPAQTDTPTHETVKPADASNRPDHREDGRSAEEPVTPLSSEGAGEEPPPGAESADNAIRAAADRNPVHGMGDDATMDEKVGGQAVVEEAGAQPPQTAAASGHDGLEPEGGPIAGGGHDVPSTEEPVGTTPVAEAAADGAEPVPDPVSSTIEAAARPELDGGAGYDRSADKNGDAPADLEGGPEVSAPKLKKTTADSGGLFGPEGLPEARNPKSTSENLVPQNQDANTDPASSAREADAQTAASKHDSDEPGATPHPVTKESTDAPGSWWDIPGRETISLRASILHPTFEKDCGRLTVEEFDEIWRSFIRAREGLDPYATDLRISFFRHKPTKLRRGRRNRHLSSDTDLINR